MAHTTVDHTGDKPARPRYLLATGDGAVQIHALPASGAVILGRGSECEVVLDHQSISRRHARLDLGEHCLLTDLGSRNGTQFRGQRLVAKEAQALAVGESFSLGSLSLLLLPPNANPPVTALAGSQLRVEDPTAEDSSGILTAVSEASANVLLLGETGAGKEVLAERIHQLSGRRGRLVAINCAALSETLLESELFGHEKGAFTGAVQLKEGLLQSAAGGTLLLDEIGEMSPAIQAKILRAIETQSILRVGGVRPLSVDVRFLAATHRDLLAAGAFRRDLYYRLAAFVLVVPPLRERKAQILRLATELLASPAVLTSEASLALVGHDWPGNVRELRNVMARALVLARGGEIRAEHILFDQAPAAPEHDDERERILAALQAHAGNQTRAARSLGISRTTLIQKLRLLDIPRPRR